MTDELEPRLRDHLRQRANRVTAPPDVADLHHRLATRDRRSTRALAAALVVALLAGPVIGWAFARSTESDRDTLTAAGGDQASAGDGDSGYRGPLLEGTGAGYLDPEMELVSERTTGEGIRLVVRSTVLGAADGPCVLDGLVRVGIEDGQLIDVALFETAPGGAAFGIAGGADGRPMWVVVARASDIAEAAFPNGAGDGASASGGLVVLAAYADEGQDAEALVDDVVQVYGLPGETDADGARAVTLSDGTAGCGASPTEPVEPEVTMPDPGEPPADEAAARDAITETFLTALDGSGKEHPDLRERPAVWADAQRRFEDEHPDLAAMAPAVYSEVNDIVFTAPDRASVRFRLVSDDPTIPAPGERVGEAVLIYGVWKVSIDTSCELVGLAGIVCDYSLKDY